MRALVDHVTTAPGGHGAAREFCDLLLTAAGRYAGLLCGPLETLDGGGEVHAGSLDYNHIERVGVLRGRDNGVLQSVSLPSKGNRQ